MSNRRAISRRPPRDVDEPPRETLDEDLPAGDDELEEDAPPLHGKVHPPFEIDEALPTLDDKARHYRHHPSESGVVDFEFVPEAGDAAADLAGDLGAQFLEGATRADDRSDVFLEHEDREETETPFVVEDTNEEPVPLPEAPKSRRRRRKAA